MKTCLRKLWKDECGLILSAELIVIATIVVLGVIVGLNCLRTALVHEMWDLGTAIDSLNQSYAYSGFSSSKGTGGFFGTGVGGGGGLFGFKAFSAGSAFIDSSEGAGGFAATGAYGRRRHSYDYDVRPSIVPRTHEPAVPCCPDDCPETGNCPEHEVPAPHGHELEPIPDAVPPAPGPAGKGKRGPALKRGGGQRK